MVRRRVVKFVEEFDVSALPTEMVIISDLKPHPRNYLEHSQEQIEHLKASIIANGFYKNIVIAKDNTILAGHGAVLAATELGYKRLPVVRLPVASDSTAALKVLAADNEIAQLAICDYSVLSELLFSIANSEAGLPGTGYDVQMAANLAYVVRPASDVDKIADASHWVGLPEYESNVLNPRLLILFSTIEDKLEFGRRNGFKLTAETKFVQWPPLQDWDNKSGDGRLKMARALERMWPGVVTISRKWGRPQHIVFDNWSRFDTPLKLKPGIDLSQLPPVDEYGMRVVEKAEIQHPVLRKLVTDYRHRYR